MSVLYKPKGPAGEYAELAVNLYRGGCPHRCLYCFVPGQLRTTRDKWLARPCEPRPGLLEQLEHDLYGQAEKQMGGDWPQVFLSFLCDPYPAGVDTGLTRTVIDLCHRYRFPVRILTKSGRLAERDFGLLDDRDAFGVTITSMTILRCFEMEPGAPGAWKRLDTLKLAKALGIPTWLSLEPVIDPGEALQVIEAVHRYADEIKIGRWNHDWRANAIDWRSFALRAKELCDKLHVKATFKKGLREYLEAQP